MKTLNFFLITAIALPFFTIAQSNDNLASNGSFEAITKKPTAPGLACKAISVSSANLTSVDLFSKDSHCGDVKAPKNYMGVQEPSTGSNYAGILAFYGDETGILNNEPGYQNYTEYLQIELTQPLIAGQTYNVNLKVSLADKSAFAISGLGIVMTKDKFEINNNSYFPIEPDMVSMDILRNDDWVTVGGTYTADGGEKYLIFGAFPDYMVIEKIIPENTNNSRKAYYYIDDVSVTSGQNNQAKKDLVFADGCFSLKNLNFETDKATILPESFPELDALATFLTNHPNLTVYIDGYADKTGSDNLNIKLSEDRANAVKFYLTNKGVSTDNLIARWYGSKHPIDERFANSTVNRRVEIMACCFK